jgi:hypothetical protein
MIMPEGILASRFLEGCADGTGFDLSKSLAFAEPAPNEPTVALDYTGALTESTSQFFVIAGQGADCGFRHTLRTVPSKYFLSQFGSIVDKSLALKWAIAVVGTSNSFRKVEDISRRVDRCRYFALSTTAPSQDLQLSFTQLIEARAGRLASAQSEALLRQIRILQEDDEFVGSLASFSKLLDFLSVHRPTRLPSLSVDDRGNFMTSWTKDSVAKLTVTFAIDGQMVWVAVDRLASERGNGIARSSGDIPPHFMSLVHA